MSIRTTSSTSWAVISIVQEPVDQVGPHAKKTTTSYPSHRLEQNTQHTFKAFTCQAYLMTAAPDALWGFAPSAPSRPTSLLKEVPLVGVGEVVEAAGQRGGQDRRVYEPRQSRLRLPFAQERDLRLRPLLEHGRDDLDGVRGGGRGRDGGGWTARRRDEGKQWPSWWKEGQRGQGRYAKRESSRIMTEDHPRQAKCGRSERLKYAPLV